MVHDALAWTQRGFAVFPLEPRGKRPLGRLVPHGLKEATLDRSIIRDWWRREPQANVGLATGGGHFVLDLDGPDAVAWFNKSRVRHGDARQTLTVKTAKGWHLFLASAKDVPSSASRIAPGVDVRGGGGYVVAPPSVHPSGVIYSIRRDLPIAEAPKWLVEAAMPPPAVPAFAQLRHRVNLDSIQGIPGIVRVIAKASIGERNAIVFWAACRLGEMVAARRIAQSLAVDDQTTISTVAEFVSRLAEHQEFSEDSLALEFAAKHHAHLRYVAPWGKWLFWARSYWEIEPTLAVFDMARKICREAARRCNKPSEGKILSKAKTVAAVETLAKADRRIAATTTQWDNDPSHLNMADNPPDIQGEH